MVKREEFNTAQEGDAPKPPTHVPPQSQAFMRSHTTPAPYGRGWHEPQYAVPATSISAELGHTSRTPKGGVSWMAPSSGYYYPRGPQPFSMASCCGGVPQGSSASGSMLTPLFSKICRPTAYHAPKPKDDTALKKQPKFTQDKDRPLIVSSHSAFHSTHGCAIRV